MGVVHLARDRETGERVALKTLRRMDARSILRLKREFRLLADVSHPSLVKMYGLGSDHEGWYLAMEYLEGQELWAYLGVDADATVADGPDSDSAPPAMARPNPLLVPTFYQLATGIAALHRSGLLHRDLKPSNVLVCGQRVVVLDFGLVRGLDADNADVTEDGGITGTPAYMAPEQARGQHLGEGTDWYAFGVMLYEALTGTLPFAGTPYEVLNAKLTIDPIPARDIDPGVPEALSDLCGRLLRVDPSARPSSAEVLAALRPAKVPHTEAGFTSLTNLSLQTGSQSHVAVTPLFGRERELEQLREAMRMVERSISVVARVHGVSGAGKSALVERFLDYLELEDHGTSQEPLLLRSRCYEREAIPFKALDGLIDTLTRRLAQMPNTLVGHLLPTNVAALARLFPVLDRLCAVQELTVRTSTDGDAVDARKQGEAALQELLTRLSATQPLVIWIDDLQWGDMDSARVLGQWLQQLSDRRILLIFSYRSEEAGTSECLQALQQAEREAGTCTFQSIDVGALGQAHVEALCRAKLGTDGGGHDELIAHIVGEADGSPFLADQLATLANAKLAEGAQNVDSVTIDQLLEQSAAMLSPEANRLLAVVAAAGRPIQPKAALRAAGIRRGSEVVHALRRLQLVRTRTSGGERLLEVYHDRIREGVLQRLAQDELQALYGQLLQVLSLSGRADPDWLHSLASAADDRPAAYRYGVAAAKRAIKSLAFERAAALYEQCISLGDPNDAAQLAELRTGCADALACAGRDAMAAEAYRSAARKAPPEQRVRLTHLASSRLLRSGYFAEGERLLVEVMDALDLTPPRTRLGLMLAILWQKLLLRVRGLRFTPRSEAEIAPALLARIDALATMRQDTAFFRPLRAAYFLLRQLNLLRDAGEPNRVILALSGLYFLGIAAGTEADERRAARILAWINALADKVGSSAAKGYAVFIQAFSHWMLGHDQAAIALSEEVDRFCREFAGSRHYGGQYIRLSSVALRVGSRINQGDFVAAEADLRPAIREAEATDNLRVPLMFAVNQALLDGVAGRSSEAVARLKRQRAHLPDGEYGQIHALYLIGVCEAAHTSGELDWGIGYLAEDWHRFTRSVVRRVPIFAVLAPVVRAHVLLSHHVRSAEPHASPPRAIDKTLRELGRAHLQHLATPFRMNLEARQLIIQGRREQALALLRDAEELSAQPMLAVHARYIRGVLTGGAKGRRLTVEALETLAAHGVVDPPQYLRARYPELFRDEAAE